MTTTERKMLDEIKSLLEALPCGPLDPEVDESPEIQPEDTMFFYASAAYKRVCRLLDSRER